MAKFSRTRRSILRALIVAAAGFPLWRFLTPKAAIGKPAVRVASEAIPRDGALVFRQARLAVLRTGEDIYALSLSCTHLGCTVTVTPTELVCPCHGSAFDRTGAVLRGPATSPLARLEVIREGDEIVVMS